VIVHGTPGEVTMVNFTNGGKNLGKQTVAKIVKTDEERRRPI
jgi:peptide-methionine (R)-S-oxide reductase